MRRRRSITAQRPIITRSTPTLTSEKSLAALLGNTNLAIWQIPLLIAIPFFDVRAYNWRLIFPWSVDNCLNPPSSLEDPLCTFRNWQVWHRVSLGVTSSATDDLAPGMTWTTTTKWRKEHWTARKLLLGRTPKVPPTHQIWIRLIDDFLAKIQVSNSQAKRREPFTSEVQSNTKFFKFFLQEFYTIVISSFLLYLIPGFWLFLRHRFS